MIDKLVQDITDADAGFLMTFSGAPFPGYSVHLEWKREEFGGNWYFCETLSMEGWLCPALLKYFESAPLNIYVKADAIGEPTQSNSGL